MDRLGGLPRAINVGDSPQSTAFRRLVESGLTTTKPRRSALPVVASPDFPVTRVAVPRSISQSLLDSLAPEVMDHMSVTPQEHIQLLAELRGFLRERSSQAASLSTKQKLTGAVECLQEEELCREILEIQRNSQRLM